MWQNISSLYYGGSSFPCYSAIPISYLSIIGRPNWDKIFTKLGEERKGNITVFYCGNPILAKILRETIVL